MTAPTTATGTDTGRPSALLRGLQIIEVLSGRGRLRVEEIADLVGIPVSSVYRYVRMLREGGYVDEVDGYYSVGRRLSLPGHGREAEHVVRLAEANLRRLRNVTGETAILTVRVHTAALCLDRVTQHRRAALSFHRGGIRPLYAGASATVLLAHAPERVLRQVLDSPMRPFTAWTPTARTLPPMLAEIAARGYSVSHGEVDPHMVSVAAPAFRRDVCVCGLSVAGPEHRLRSGRLDACVAAVLEEAAELSRRLHSTLGAAAWTPGEEL